MLRITKDTLRLLNAAAGKLDTDSNAVFFGFVGRLEMSDRLYHGELRFIPTGVELPPDTVSLQAILSPDSSGKPDVKQPARQTRRANLTTKEK